MKTNKFYKIGITAFFALLLFLLIVMLSYYPSPHVQWVYKSPESIYKIKLAGDGKHVFIKDYKGIAVVDARTGREEWSHRINWELQNCLIGLDSKIIVDESVQLKTFNLTTGNMDWTYKPNASVLSVTSFKDKVICTTKQKVAVLDEHTGKPAWFLNQGNENFSTALGNDGLIYIAGNKLYACDARTGRMQWTFTPLGGLPPFEIGLCKHLFVSEQSTQTLYAVNPSSGKVIWKSQVPEACTPLGLDKDHHHVIMHSDRSLYGFDLASGKLNWKYETYQSLQSILGPENIIYSANVLRGQVVSLDGASGRVRWATYIGEQTSQPVLGPGNTLYLCADFDQFTVLNRDTGAVIDHFSLGASLIDHLNIIYGYATVKSTEPVIGSDGMIYAGSAVKKAFAFRYPR